jgi:hypothetical protein
MEVFDGVVSFRKDMGIFFPTTYRPGSIWFSPIYLLPDFHPTLHIRAF